MQVTKIKRVSIRDFRKTPSKYLSSLPIEITNHGKYMCTCIFSPESKVEIKCAHNLDNCAHNFADIIKNVHTITNKISVYGCGCERGKERLCQKHQRL